ncbi:SMI1/KNR4 family protein [Nocardia huaxiensis]|uniref:SMI1/KNR4 family protein n=1 Tax=Nocardia huaxiensis TaxID=2755382 RepID=A0A7D6V7W3_9NOCA|nr:SMI1/KNR4 family protein [Nocardia huaxiensis]QLY28413.1 SMI1/KNR4 family protein [Nocardia huaxiensis]
MTMGRILAFYEQHSPGKRAHFQSPATAADFEVFRTAFGEPFPVQLLPIYSVCNGTGRDGDFFGHRLLSVEEMIDERRLWNSIIEESDDPDEEYHDVIESVSPTRVKAHYWHPGWVSFTADWGGNGFAVDFAPEPAGVPGQVINYGADDDWRGVIAGSVDEFLGVLVGYLERGAFTVDPTYGTVDLGTDGACLTSELMP